MYILYRHTTCYSLRSLKQLEQSKSQLLVLGNWGMVEGRFSKWFWSVKKGALNPFLSISMTYNVISCQKVAENTQILKIAKFAM